MNICPAESSTPTFMDAKAQQLADQWLKLDPDPKTKAEVEQLIKSNNSSEILKLLDPTNRLEFGTAGLRGKIAAGYCCMNQVVIM